MIGKFWGLPKQLSSGKCEHLARAMSFASISEKQDVILIDDDPNNCRLAVKMGFRAINVPQYPDAEPSYLANLHTEIQ